MKRLELVLLDYDQTLVDNTVDFYEAYCGALLHFGSKCISYDEFQELLVTNNLQSKIPRGVDPEEFFRVFRRLYISRHSIPQPGLREFLVTMKKLNIKTIVVSGRETHAWYITWDLARHGFLDYIDDVLTINDLVYLGQREKFLFDKTPLYEYAMKKHGVTGLTICIGDYVTDYYSCKSINGVFIGLNKHPERNHFLIKEGVKMTARDFYEVLTLISDAGLLR